MPTMVERTYDEVRVLAKDYFGISDSESETLMKLAKQCAKTAGMPMAGAGAAALSGVVSVAVPLIGSIPRYVAYTLDLFIGGITACMIARRSIGEHAKQIIGQSKMSEQEFKAEIRHLISLAHGKAGYCQNLGSG